MRICLKPAGIIRRYVAQTDMAVSPDLTISGLVTLLAIPPELKLMVFVNGKRKDPAESLQDGDEVRLITLLSGG